MIIIQSWYKAANDKCIFSGEENSEVAFVSLAIGVCCGKCKAKFEKKADEHILKVTFPAKAEGGKAAAAKKTAGAETKLVALFDDGSCCISRVVAYHLCC